MKRGEDSQREKGKRGEERGEDGGERERERTRTILGIEVYKAKNKYFTVRYLIRWYDDKYFNNQITNLNFYDDKKK